MKVVIEGAGEVGSHLAKMLRSDGNSVTVIDNDAARLNRLSVYADVETIEGNPSSIEVLERAGAAEADLYIAVYPFVPQEVNLMGAILAKKLGSKRVIARIGDEELLTAESRRLLRETGIDQVIYPERIAADEIVDALANNLSSDNMDFAHGKLKISVFRLDENSSLPDLRLSEFVAMNPPEDLQKFRIIAISRSDSTIIPKLDTRFRFGDLVFTISKEEGEECLKRFFGDNRIRSSAVMIMGGTPTAEMLARSLDAQGIQVKLIDKDRERCIALSERLPDSILIVNGDGRNSDFLLEESIGEYDTFIALTNKDESNILSCVAAEKLGIASSIAAVETIEYIRLAEEMGVDQVIHKKLITASRILKFTLSSKARFVKYMAGTNAEIMEYFVEVGCPITKGPLKSISFPENAMVGGVIRGDEAEIAVGDTQIQPGDRVVVFSMGASVKAVDKLFR